LHGSVGDWRGRGRSWMCCACLPHPGRWGNEHVRGAFASVDCGPINLGRRTAEGGCPYAGGGLVLVSCLVSWFSSILRTASRFLIPQGLRRGLGFVKFSDLFGGARRQPRR
jgi:hypothetical protein